MFTPKVTETPPRLQPVSADPFAADPAGARRFEPVAERPRTARSQRSVVAASLVLSRREDRPTSRRPGVEEH
jgi:hypothetical protein